MMDMKRLGRKRYLYDCGTIPAFLEVTKDGHEIPQSGYPVSWAGLEPGTSLRQFESVTAGVRPRCSDCKSDFSGNLPLDNSAAS